MTTDTLRQDIWDTVSAIVPLDEAERVEQNSVLSWIDSGAPLFREHGDVPARHLAVYFAFLDDERGTVLQVNHVKAQAWLFPGGHVDTEAPSLSALREAEEELGVQASFHPAFGPTPVFVTESVTRGPMSHTDVTLWFVLHGNQDMTMTGDEREFSGVRWVPIGEVDSWAQDSFAPHQVRRFMVKMKQVLDQRPIAV
jgi:8-oxo-dGTP diphosphatase